VVLVDRSDDVPDLMTYAEYASHRKAKGLSGGTGQAVAKAVASGRISLIDGKIDPDVADIQWAANTRRRADYHGNKEIDRGEGKKTVSVGDNPADWANAKARTEAATAALKELELEERRGNLVDKAGTERAAFSLARVLRDALVTTLPSKYAAELAALSDPWDLECRLREVMRNELTAVSGMVLEDPEESSDEAA
jgi:hypothetical protein